MGSLLTTPPVPGDADLRAACRPRVVSDASIVIVRDGRWLHVSRGADRMSAQADAVVEAKELETRARWWAHRGDPFRGGAAWDLRALLEHIDTEHQAMRARRARVAGSARYRIARAA